MNMEYIPFHVNDSRLQTRTVLREPKVRNVAMIKRMENYDSELNFIHILVCIYIYISKIRVRRISC